MNKSKQIVKVSKPLSKKKKVKAKVKSIGNSNTLRPKLSMCAEEYVCALEDPFNCSATACVPTYPSFPSRKMIAFAKGTLTVGTAGVGFLFSNGTLANDQNAGWYTTSTFAGTTLSTGAAGVNAISLNGDYNNSAYGSTPGFIQSRMVGFGIRVRYTGTELNRSGEIRVLEEPFHLSLSGTSAASFDAYDKSRKFQVNRQWTAVTYHPVFPSDLDYTASDNPVGTNGFLGILITSLSQNTFDFEIFCLAELIGSTVRGKTPSISDTIGADAIYNVVQSREKDGYQGQPPIQRILNLATDAISNVMSGIWSFAWENRALIGGTLLKTFGA